MAKQPAVYCPFCNAQESSDQSENIPMDNAPVRIPMKATHVKDGRAETAQPFTAPHFTYTCPRCSYIELHEQVVF